MNGLDLSLPIKPSPEVLQIVRSDSDQFAAYLDFILLLQDSILHFADDGHPRFEKAKALGLIELRLDALRQNSIVFQNVEANQSVHMQLLNFLEVAEAQDSITIQRKIKAYVAGTMDIYRIVHSVTPNIPLPDEDEFTAPKPRFYLLYTQYTDIDVVEEVANIFSANGAHILRRLSGDNYDCMENAHINEHDRVIFIASEQEDKVYVGTNLLVVADKNLKAKFRPNFNPIYYKDLIDWIDR